MGKIERINFLKILWKNLSTKENNIRRGGPLDGFRAYNFEWEGGYKELF